MKLVQHSQRVEKKVPRMKAGISMTSLTWFLLLIGIFTIDL